jgi:hypothetical protein
MEIGRMDPGFYFKNIFSPCSQYTKTVFFWNGMSLFDRSLVLSLINVLPSLAGGKGEVNDLYCNAWNLLYRLLAVSLLQLLKNNICSQP